jgi:Antitoxin component of bacterial toxin-antitoxin system, MqsA
VAYLCFNFNAIPKRNPPPHRLYARFGVGVNAFSRYENGKTKPPLALVKLLKMLDRHPDLLAEVRAV